MTGTAGRAGAMAGLARRGSFWTRTCQVIDD
jgi:hypothetical protein